MKKNVSGSMVTMDGEEFYKIENFDAMNDFFMTIASSSDVWNFCWAQGGISAGRRNCELPIFPYCTSDKIKDTKGCTGPVSIIKIKGDGKRSIVWQPFGNLFSTGAKRYEDGIGIQRNIYKNMNGSKVWFEEVNFVAGLSCRYGWTSSAKYGLVRLFRIENLTDRKVDLSVLDGCRNIMPSPCPSTLQNERSVLLDAYRKGEVDSDANIALFTLSSTVTDMAEPSESLTTNVSWFTTNDPVVVSDRAVELFMEDKTDLLLAQEGELNGKRGECYIIHRSTLSGRSAECWEQVFDVGYDSARLAELEAEIGDRGKAWKILEDDIRETDARLTAKIAAADGIQRSGNPIADLHHRTNVMFNIMRGGIFTDGGRIPVADFIDFAEKRNVSLGWKMRGVLANAGLAATAKISRDKLKSVIQAEENPQMTRLFFEYLPLTFSRRHGDPSRPWNKFDIDVRSLDGSDKINYEGNWRDIFQNWESLLWSYPEYSANVVAVFVDAMTVDGFNPYRISRRGIDWEVPEPGNPWAQFGYWGDHQVVYLQRIIEFLWNFDRGELLSMMSERIFSTADIPYRLKGYNEILSDPRHSLRFDNAIDSAVRAREKEFGTDARSIVEWDGSLQLTTLSTKLIQLILAKVLNHIPGAGIWMNTQRPEWNDANNALAGYGTSVVTMCHLERMLSFLAKLFDTAGDVMVDSTVAGCLNDAAEIYRQFSLDESAAMDDKKRKSFADAAGLLFERERNALYERGFGNGQDKVSGKKIATYMRLFRDGIKKSIAENMRDDGLFHSYNSIVISDDEIKIERLKLMLEGQVAALGCSLLTKNEKKTMCAALHKSALYEENQRSYLLYPNERLPKFKEKNRISRDEIKGLERFATRQCGMVLVEDRNGTFHFNHLFRNAACMTEYLDHLPQEEQPGADERKALLELYEKVFHHRTFTGRSGTFYAYEGLGSIYWHMVSKLLIAVQENISNSRDPLFSFYKDVKSGLGSAKQPADYGAFPCDPYSHTPYKRGAQQPGMTGQVKEEILGRWMELGLGMQCGKASFAPSYLEKGDFDESGKICFSWCGTSIEYDRNMTDAMNVVFSDGTERTFPTRVLPEEESRLLFSRSGKITLIRVRP